jgi:hypothetical protein
VFSEFSVVSDSFPVLASTSASAAAVLRVPLGIALTEQHSTVQRIKERREGGSQEDTQRANSDARTCNESKVSNILSAEVRNEHRLSKGKDSSGYGTLS